MSEERRCTCGCGKLWSTVISEIMSVSSLNYDQAEDSLIRAEAERERLKNEEH